MMSSLIAHEDARAQSLSSSRGRGLDHLLIYLFAYLVYMCVPVDYMYGHTLQRTRVGVRGQRATMWSWFPPSTFTWVLRSKLRSSDLQGKHLLPTAVI